MKENQGHPNEVSSKELKELLKTAGLSEKQLKAGNFQLERQKQRQANKTE